MSCNRTAPTQTKLPPVMPEYPFEHICMDYMDYMDMDYMDTVMVSLWTGLQIGRVSTMAELRQMW